MRVCILAYGHNSIGSELITQAFQKLHPTILFDLLAINEINDIPPNLSDLVNNLLKYDLIIVPLVTADMTIKSSKIYSGFHEVEYDAEHDRAERLELKKTINEAHENLMNTLKSNLRVSPLHVTYVGGYNYDRVIRLTYTKVTISCGYHSPLLDIRKNPDYYKPLNDSLLEYIKRSFYGPVLDVIYAYSYELKCHTYHLPLSNEEINLVLNPLPVHTLCYLKLVRYDDGSHSLKQESAAQNFLLLEYNTRLINLAKLINEQVIEAKLNWLSTYFALALGCSDLRIIQPIKKSLTTTEWKAVYEDTLYVPMGRITCSQDTHLD